MQFYTASTRKANRLSIALTNLTGHPPSLFRFPGGGWAVQEESLSAAAGQAIGRLLSYGVRCDRITGPMVLAELVAGGSDRGARTRHEAGRAGSGGRHDQQTPLSSGAGNEADDERTMGGRRVMTVVSASSASRARLPRSGEAGPDFPPHRRVRRARSAALLLPFQLRPLQPHSPAPDL